MKRFPNRHVNLNIVNIKENHMQTHKKSNAFQLCPITHGQCMVLFFSPQKPQVFFYISVPDGFKLQRLGRGWVNTCLWQQAGVRPIKTELFKSQSSLPPQRKHHMHYTQALLAKPGISREIQWWLWHRLVIHNVIILKQSADQTSSDILLCSTTIRGHSLIIYYISGCSNP